MPYTVPFLEVTGCSGTTIAAKAPYAVRFHEFDLADFWPEDTTPGTVPAGIQSLVLDPNRHVDELMQYPSLCPDKYAALPLVDSKWVYVFKQSGKKCWLSGEAYVKVEGENQVFECVDWSGSAEEIEKRWKDTYPRKPVGTKRKKFRIDVSNNVFIFISQEQIPLSRIRFYGKNPDALAQRSLFIAAGTPVSGPEPVDIPLLDFVKLCSQHYERYLAPLNEYRDLQKQHNEFMDDENNAARISYTHMVVDLADKHEQVMENVRYEDALKYIEKVEHTERIKTLSATMDTNALLLGAWMKTPGYVQARNDYREHEELLTVIAVHEGQMVPDLWACNEGRKYIEEIASDSDSWINRVVDGSEAGFSEAFTATRKSARSIGGYLELIYGKYFMEIVTALKDEEKFLKDALKKEWESDELYRNRKAILDDIRKSRAPGGALDSGRKGFRSRKRLTARKKALLIQHKLQDMLHKYDIPDCSPEKVRFLSANSEKLIFDAGLRLKSTRDIRQARDAVISIQEEYIRKSIASGHTEAAAFRNEADDAARRADYVEGIRKKWVSSGLPVAVGKVIMLVDQVNFLLAALSFADAVEEGDRADAVFATTRLLGGFIDAAVHYETIVKTITKNYADDTAKSLARAGRYTAGKAAQEAAERIVFRYLDIASGAIDSLVSMYQLYKYAKRGSYKQMIGESLICIGSIVGTLAAAGGLYGLCVGKAIVVLGISTGGWGLIAAGIMVLGAFLAWLLRPKPLRDWARDCYWENDTTINEFEELRKVQIQINARKLLENFADFKVCPYLKMEYHPALPASASKYTVNAFCIRIIPGIFDKSRSQFLVSLKAWYNPTSIWYSDTVVFNKKDIVFNSKNSVIGYCNGKQSDGIEYIERSWSVAELEKMAQRNGYLNESLRKLFSMWRNKFYLYDDRKSRISVESYGKFEADWKARLDFNGERADALTIGDVSNRSDFIFPVDEPMEGHGDDFWAMTNFREEKFFDIMQRAIAR
jgi:hypothetical protein